MGVASDLFPVLAAFTGLLAVVVLSAREPLFAGRSDLRLLAGAAWVLSSIAFTVRAYVTRDWHGDTFLAAAGLYWLVVLVTLGRPALIMDQLFTMDRPKERPSMPDHLKKRTGWGQVALIIGIVGIAILWTS